MLIRPKNQKNDSLWWRMGSQPVANYVVPDAAFASGAPITLDLAWPEFKVAVVNMMAIIIVRVRLNGAVTKRRGVLVGRRWLVFVATACKYR